MLLVLASSAVHGMSWGCCSAQVSRCFRLFYLFIFTTPFLGWEVLPFYRERPRTWQRKKNILLSKLVTEEGSQVPGQLLISLEVFNLMSFSWGSPGLRGMILPRDGPGSVLWSTHPWGLERNWRQDCTAEPKPWILIPLNLGKVQIWSWMLWFRPVLNIYLLNPWKQKQHLTFKAVEKLN